MFLIDFIFIGIGSVLILFAFIILVFSNRFFDILTDNAVHIVCFVIGFSFLFASSLLPVFFNRCDSCQKYVCSDYCTACGSFVASDLNCSCGANLYDRYSFCPSCGKELEDLDDET